MAQLLDKVQTGAIITAKDWNLMVDAVNGLLQANQTSGIKIAAVDPAGTDVQPIEIGTVMQITGENFGYAVGQSSVTFEADSGPVTVTRNEMLLGSGDSRLLLIVRPIPGLAQNGAFMMMTVDNGVAHDSRRVFVKPVVIVLSGDLFVNWRGDTSPNPNPNPVKAKAQADFNWQIETNVNLPATYTLAVDIPNAAAGVPAGLLSSVQILDPTTNTPIANQRVDMGKNEKRNVRVRIPLIPESWANQPFSLTLTASSGNLTNSDTRSFTVGVVEQELDPNIKANETGHVIFNLDTHQQETDPANGELAGTTIKLKEKREMDVQFNVQLLKAGTYDVTVEWMAGAAPAGWQKMLVGATLPSVNVATDNDQTSRFMQFGVSAATGAAAAGGVVFRIKRQGADLDWSKEYTLQLL